MIPPLPAISSSESNESPTYPWRSYSVLRTHDFAELRPLDALPPRLFLCRSCNRAFRFDPTSRRTWAVASNGRHAPLRKAISERWVAQRCAGRPCTD